jgi:hypothetical protein
MPNKKKIRFLVEFDRPAKDEVLKFECPFCGAVPGQKCFRSDPYRRDNHETPISEPHQQRYGECLNLELVVQAYRIKP